MSKYFVVLFSQKCTDYLNTLKQSQTKFIEDMRNWAKLKTLFFLENLTMVK